MNSACGFCFDKLVSLSQPKWQEFDRVPSQMVALYEWRPNESSMLNVFMNHQKKASSNVLVRKLVGQILTYQVKEKICQTDALVPVPSRLGSHPDHAFRIAEAIAELTSLPIVNPLRSAAARAQKNLGSAERARIHFEVISEKFAKYHRLTLVDDVVTSGQTMKAMINALSGVQKFQVFCLARRVFVDPNRDKC